MDRETSRAQATLEIELSGEAPAGELISVDGVQRRFDGWTEFASAIEEWRSEAATAGALEEQA